MQPYYIAAIVISVVLLLLFLFACLIYIFAFGKRIDKNPSFKYFTAEDFSLTAQPVALSDGLNGFIYGKGEPKKDKLIIVCHGMGAGHIAYSTEIAYFCNLGYTMLAVDSFGCNFSEGKRIKGMYSGVRTAVSAVDYAKSLYPLQKVWLIGHSWGAYSALCASTERKVDGVVAISSPLTPSKTIQQASARIISKPFSAILRPFLWFVNFLTYGKNGNKNAAKCAIKSGVPTLLIHGDKDKVVPIKGSAFAKANGKNITKLIAEGKGHNPYNTANAEKLLARLFSLKDFSEFDFKGATEEDEEVMRAVADFISEN